MAEAKYTVAKGYSFTAQGYIYRGGDEIPAAIFADKTVLASYVSEGRIIETKPAARMAHPEPVEPAEEEIPVKISRKKGTK